MRLLPTALGLVMAAGGALVTVSPAAAASAPLPHPVGGFQAPSTRVDVAPRMGTFGVLPASATTLANLPPVGDQGQISDCVAWTIAHTVMGYYAKKDGASGAPYAPLYLYMRSVAKGGAPDQGLVPEKALTEAATNGVDTEADYTQGYYNYSTPPTAAQVANAAKYKVGSWQTLWVGAGQGDKAKTAMQTAIAAGSPVAIGMPVYRDFMYLNSSALYKTTSGTNLGGHMITAYAYDAEGIWIRNQWGTSWGAAGDAHLAWSFVTTNVMAAYTISGVKTSASPPATAKPAVTSLSAIRGSTAGGTEVRITGTNIGTATAVKFGDTSATFRKVDANTLVATSPARAKGVVDVTVTTSGGTSAVGAQTKFTYVPPAPAVTRLSKSSTSTLGAETITITGTNFSEATAVRVGGVAGGSLKVLSDTSASFIVPTTLKAGVYDVTVTTPYGTSAAVAADKLTLVTPPLPTIKSLSATSGPTNVATPITVTGTNFTGTKAVTAGGVAVAYQVVSDTQLKVTMPVHAAGKVTLKVTNLGGSVEGVAVPFTYVTPAPKVSAVSPSTGKAKVSTTVELAGVNLGSATKVTVNGTTVAFTKVSDTKLRVVMPALGAGTSSVQVTTAGGTSASTFIYKS